jgi:tetrapyrrole methylase family protein/MazG family protein
VTERAGRVVVVGLGPAGVEGVTPAVRHAIDAVSPRFLRTSRHPAAAAVDGATSFDSVYDKADTLEQVYGAIVDALVEAAEAAGEVLYAVPGSPLVAERTVDLLRRDGRVAVEIIPAMSFLDLAWNALGVDPLALGVRLVDGHRFAVEAAGERGPLLVAQCDTRDVLSDIKLAVDGAPAPAPVTVLQRLGLPDEHVVDVAWHDLDRAVEVDHLTSLWIPELAAPIGREFAATVELSRVLRDRCPWDREQTHASLLPYLLEETYETVEAVQALTESGDYTHVEEELGDVLYQVIFHSTLAAEQGAFTIADVARGIHDKLVRRHPHVFGDTVAASAGEQTSNWEQLKAAEKGRHGVFDGVPAGLPGLLYASKLQSRAAGVGFDWKAVDDVYPKVAEELAELRADPSEDEVGDLLFAVVNVARHLGIDPEVAVRRAAVKFRTRFEAVEGLAAERGIGLASVDLDALDTLWDEIKQKESNGRS